MSTPRYRATAPILGALLFVLVSGLAVPTQAADPEPLAGTVRDTVGNVLAGVEVLFVRMPSDRFTPTAVAHTDRAGRFRVAKLVPGRYRIAALKQGYRTFVGQIDTFARETIDLVLRPAVKVEQASLPRDSSWALRLPRRGMLHETGAGPEPAGRDVESGANASPEEALRLELAQFFSLSAGVAEEHPEDTEIQPSETRMMLASAIGERGNFLVKGRREQLGATSSNDLQGSTANLSDASVNLNLSYDTSPDAQLAVTAFFNQIDYELSAGPLEAPAALEQQQQTWGYDASWSKQIDAARRFVVALVYQDTSLVRPAHEEIPTPTFTADPRSAVSNRAVGAHGTYESVMSERHDVQFALRTQLLSWPTTAPRMVWLRPDAADQSTWTVQADAQDTWALSAPFSLVYGLAYKQAWTAREASLVVPRLGGSVAVGGWYLRALVSYHSVTGSEEPIAARGIAPLRPAESLGYEAEVEMPVARNVRLRGGVSYSPIQFNHVGYFGGADAHDEHPLYLTDGNSAVHEHRLALVEERGSSRMYLELSDGRAEGTVAPLLPFAGPPAVRPGRQLRYWNGRFGVMVPSWGTDLRVEYRRVEAARTLWRRDILDSIQESVEVRVRQDVAERQIPGDWQLLMALRLGTVRSNDLEAWSPDGGADSLDALNRRISAGVSVLF
jgi:hypothetical protein